MIGQTFNLFFFCFDDDLCLPSYLLVDFKNDRNQSVTIENLIKSTILKPTNYCTRVNSTTVHATNITDVIE